MWPGCESVKEEKSRGEERNLVRIKMRTEFTYIWGLWSNLMLKVIIF